MPQFRISLVEKLFRPMKKMAEEYGMSMSDIISEAVEWILDQEDDFRKDLEAELGEEAEEEAEGSESESEEGEEGEEEESEE